jgi:hypothetical protein
VYRVLRQLADPFSVVLLAAAVANALLPDAPGPVVIAFVLSVKTAIEMAQEVRDDPGIPAANLIVSGPVVVSAGDVVVLGLAQLGVSPDIRGPRRLAARATRVVARRRGRKSLRVGPSDRATASADWAKLESAREV